MVLWRGLSSISSSAEAELGEVVMFWAAENNLKTLVLSGSLPCPEGCRWLMEVSGRGWQLQLDLSSLSGCSHHQHVPAFGTQLSRILLSPSSLMKQHGLVELQTLPLQLWSGENLCACSSQRWDSDKTNSGAIVPFLLCFTFLGCKMRGRFPNLCKQVVLDQLHAECHNKVSCALASLTFSTP